MRTDSGQRKSVVVGVANAAASVGRQGVWAVTGSGQEAHHAVVPELFCVFAFVQFAVVAPELLCVFIFAQCCFAYI